MLVASVFLIRTFLTSFLMNPLGQATVSLDWAGYTVTTSSLNPQPVLIGVNGSWTVPTVSASIGDTYSAAWIGIGGQLEGDSTLIQVGTEHDSISGQPEYSAWYELLPNDSVTITTINVSPGDEITASINLTDSNTNEWIVEINDVTQGQEFSENFFYVSSKLSAEWVVERPTVGNHLSTLADFGHVTFTNASARTDTSVEKINDFSFSQVIMQDRQNRQLVTVSSLSSDGSSFTVSYLSSVAATQRQLDRFLEIKVAVTPKNTVPFGCAL
jgi:hypothetical protein